MLDLLLSLIEFILHIDLYLGSFILKYGFFVYGIIFIIIFIETGLVIMPFLPGDSLLFAAGAFAAIGSLNLFILFLICVGAAIIGDTINYWVGNKFGRKLFRKEDSWLFKQKYLIETEKFYEKHGGKTIIFARFIPFIRTFAPFVAGMGNMHYSRFLSYNALGGLAWVSLFVFAGYFFGTIPFVKENFSLVIMAIIVISILPIIIKGYFGYRKSKKINY
jgi:membrane-associated protein